MSTSWIANVARGLWNSEIKNQVSWRCFWSKPGSRNEGERRPTEVGLAATQRWPRGSSAA